MAEVRFQVPPDQYDKQYFSFLLRDIRQLFIQLTTPTVTTIGKLIFIPPSVVSGQPAGIPTSGSGQPIGTVYVDGDTLKMVVAGTGYAPSFLLTVSLGTVTATG